MIIKDIFIIYRHRRAVIKTENKIWTRGHQW